jgi:hypothetical protein
VWAPAGGEADQGLWLHSDLRLLFCRAVWTQVCHSRVAGGGMSPVSGRGSCNGCAQLPGRFAWTGCGSRRPCLVLLCCHPGVSLTKLSSSRRSSSRNSGASATSLPTLPCLLHGVRRSGAACTCAASPTGVSALTVGADQPPGSLLWRVLVYVVVDLATYGFRWLSVCVSPGGSTGLSCA